MHTIIFPGESEIKTWIREAVQECLEGALPQKQEPQMEEPLITRKDVARMLGVSLVTLNDWAKKGLPSHKVNGRVYFQRSEVLEYVKGCHNHLGFRLPPPNH
ncbi:helix-turn-helix domain-containing protein [Paraflavisolibacter sp. H34]|uniref:helix-turn-helix domain-containing protein n=1 Tax=Huijunlia imazamoxiresistens TaxID=3127457 RepID=UPI00301A89EC